MEQVNDQRQIDHQNMMINAYFAANWTRAKRMPSYRNIMKNLGIETTARQQSPKEHLSILEKLTVQMGGVDLRKKDAN